MNTTQPSEGFVWEAKHVYTMAFTCLLIGLAIGYLFRGSQSPDKSAPSAAGGQPAGAAATMAGQTPSLEDMKWMADQKAAPLLEKLKTDPNNSDLLIQVGNIYTASHQFKQAADSYQKALQTDPKNVTVRTDMASCLYYIGDVDGAITQLQQNLHYDPNDAASLFNLGLFKWKGKQDGRGAVAAWHQLLKSNPDLSMDRKATVQQLLTEVQNQHKR